MFMEKLACKLYIKYSALITYKGCLGPGTVL